MVISNQLIISVGLKIFNMSLKSSVGALSEQFHEIKQSLGLFPYFDAWDENAVSECCQISAIMEFSPNEMILDVTAVKSSPLRMPAAELAGETRFGREPSKGPGSANSQMAFFILEGVCTIIHQIYVRIRVDSYGRTKYKLYSTEKMNSSSNFQSANFGNVLMSLDQKNECSDAKCSGQNSERESVSSAEKENFAGNDIKDECSMWEASGNEENDDGVDESGTIKSGSKAGGNEEIAMELKMNESVERNHEGVKVKSESSKVESKEDEGEVEYRSDHHLKVLKECRAKSKQIFRLAENGSAPEKPDGVKSFFVQVALFYKGACFGLEENLKNNFVMSATKVKCLRIPRRFLFQHNPCNVWNRIRLFFNLYLPEEKQILDYLASDRNWNKAKQRMTEEIVSLKKIPNYVLCTEVPLSIRLVEIPR